MMKRLYKGGEISPFLHPVDAIDWQKLGWSESPNEAKPNALQTQKETPKEIDAPTNSSAPEEATITPDETPDQVTAMEARYMELDAMSWREIKALHEDEYELGDYPGKGEAIAAILKAEGLG
jgi:hypothetical protein